MPKPPPKIHARTQEITACGRTGLIITDSRDGSPIELKYATRPSTSAPSRHRAILLVPVGICENHADPEDHHPVYGQVSDIRLEMN